MKSGMRHFVFNGNSFLLRTKKWAYIQHKENASGGIQLFDMEKDPQQFTNLVKSPEHQKVVEEFRTKLKAKLIEVRDCDLQKMPKSKLVK